jgi:hypothetical protein
MMQRYYFFWNYRFSCQQFRIPLVNTTTLDQALPILDRIAEHYR